MKAVHLNQELVLEARQSVSDGAGGMQSGWVRLGTLWAEVRGGSGRIAGGAAQVVSETAYRIVVRAAPAGSPARPVAGQRLRSGVRVWQIEAVREYDHAARFLICFAKEEVAA